ncbi:MAG: hypothetical protein DRI86_04655 [Bacteroidetes bacterium]|nr:MAG: hypothetical protein DRI86_04655 [Bacteroidota bacterium]
MKKLFLISLIFLSINSLAQFATMFNDTLKPFGEGGYDFACVTQDDSFYYALGGVNNYEPYWSNMIVKYDKNFNIVNKQKYIDIAWRYANYPYNTIVVNEKQILTCPQVFNDSATFGKIMSIDKYSLDTLWTKIITHPDTIIANQPNSGQFSDLTSIKQTLDGGYILTGNYNKNCITANLRSFLLKIDSIGNVEWRRTYPNISYLYDIELTPNGGYIVINKNWGTIIVELDSIGNIIWQQKINTDTINANVSDMSYSGNNTFVGIVKYIKNGNISYPEYGLIVFKINISTKQIIWQKKYNIYKSLKCVGLHQAMGVETLSDGSIIVNGTVIKYGTDYSAFILKLNTNGDSLWTKTYCYKNSNISRSQLNDLMACDDGGFLGVGFYSAQAGGVSTAWMFKTDANGLVGWESPKPKGKSEIFKVWPNPARDYVNIEFAKNLKQESEIIIYNSLGQRVKTLILQKQQLEKEIHLQGFKTGIYYFELRANNSIIGTGKFIKE